MSDVPPQLFGWRCSHHTARMALQPQRYDVSTGRCLWAQRVVCAAQRSPWVENSQSIRQIGLIAKRSDVRRPKTSFPPPVHHEHLTVHDRRLRARKQGLFVRQQRQILRPWSGQGTLLSHCLPQSVRFAKNHSVACCALFSASM